MYLETLSLGITAMTLSIFGAISYCRSRGKKGGGTMCLGQILGLVNLVLLALAESQ